MSNPMLATTNSKLDIRVKEPSDGAPPTSGIGGPSFDRFNGVLENKNNQSLDKQLNFTKGHIENNFTEGPIENPAIGGSKQIVIRGDQHNDFAIRLSEIAIMTST